MVTEKTEGRAPEVRMAGGLATTLVPISVLIALLLWLSIEERATASGFWVGGWAALAVGVVLTTTKRAFAESIIRGLADRTGAVIVTAFIFAGVFGKLLVGAGLVNGLLWLGLETGLQGASFTVIAFGLSCVFAAGIGTSAGTVIAMIPVLYPAGLFFGADPTMLAVAILAGGAFGDNLAPISDTTIASAYTQDAAMGDVVKSRLPLTLASAAVALIVFAIAGGSGGAVGQNVAADVTPVGLTMLIPFALVIVLALRRHHIIVALTWGSITAIVGGLLSGMMAPGDIFSIPGEPGASTGLIEDGISGVTGAVIFVLFVLALGRLLTDSGLMARLLGKLEARAARGVRSAEFTIVSASLLFSIPLSANAPAILLVGPTVAKPLGRRYNLAPARIANLLDCTVCTVYYMLPWHNIAIIWFGVLVETADEHGLPLPSIGAAFLNPYSWALLVVVAISVLTGWNRQYAAQRA